MRGKHEAPRRTSPITIAGTLLLGATVTLMLAAQGGGASADVKPDEPTPQVVISKTETTPQTAAVQIIVDVRSADPIERIEYVQEPAEAPAEPEPPEVDHDDWERLTCAIYREAGGNAACDLCRHRVDDVILNRVEDERFPDTIEAVLTQKAQYGDMYWTGIVWPERAQYETEQAAVQRAYDTAYALLAGEHSDLYGAGYIWQAEFPQGTDGIYCCGTYFGR